VRSASTSGLAKRVFKFELPEGKSKCIILPDASTAATDQDQDQDQDQAGTNSTSANLTTTATTTTATDPSPLSAATVPTLREEFQKLCEVRSWDASQYHLTDIDEAVLDGDTRLADVPEYTVAVIGMMF
jgi:hypothetical protein